MTKKTIGIVIGVVVLVALAVAAYATTMQPPKDSDKTASSKAAPANDESKETPKSDSATKAGTYVDYSDTAIASSDGTILLFFHAPWCPQCRSIDASITSGGVPDDVTVIKVDYDSHQDLRQKYGVTLQTTFLKVDQSGKKLDSYVAYQEPTFSSVKKALLP